MGPLEKTSGARTRIGRSGRRLAMALVATLVGLVVLELAARLWEGAAHGTVRLGGGPVGVYRDGETAPRSGPMLRPGVRLDGLGHAFTVNSLGFRGPELLAVKPPGGLRVWVVGGSSTFDICVSDDAAAWPARLQAALAAASPGTVVEVINAGVPGGRLAENRADFVRLADQVQPDVLVIHHGPNDLRVLATAKHGGATLPAGRLTELGLYRVLSNALPAPAPDPSWASHRIVRADLEPLRMEVQALVDEARARGVRVVITSHGHSAPDDASALLARLRIGKDARTLGLPPLAYIEAYREMNAMFRELAEAQGHLFVDLRAAVPPDPRYWNGDIHFRDEGAALAGAAVAEAMVEAGLNRPRGQR